MTITINGTTGISGVDGSAGTPSLQGQDTNTGFFYGTDILGFSTGGSERMRIDASGNVGIGTNSPTGKLHLYGAAGTAQITQDSSTAFRVIANNGLNYIQSGAALSSDSKAPLLFTSMFGVTEWMRLDTSGNLGLGVTPSAWYSGWRILQVGAGGNISCGSVSDVRFGTNYYFDSTGTDRFIGSGYASAYVQNGGVHTWKSSTTSGTAGAAISFTQAMMLDASGNLLVGTTSSYSGKLNISGYTNGGWYGIRMRPTADNSTPMEFLNASGSAVGAIQCSSTNTTYNTSSDYRLKENIQPMQNALDVVAQLNPVTYTWKADGSDGQGFIAHELQTVVPDCVTGEKDAVDKDGNPIYQGIDTSFLVATLTKAIQELTARIEQLEAK